MEEYPRPEEITVILERLADRLAAGRGLRPDKVAGLSLHRLILGLRQRIPGLYQPPDYGAAKQLAASSAEAIKRGQVRAGLARALRGLSFSPHDPELWYLAAGGCLQMGMAETAVAILQYCLWVNPAHLPARRDLEALSAFHQSPIEPEDSWSSDDEWDDEDRDEHFEEDDD